jgi:hypothetical protein
MDEQVQKELEALKGMVIAWKKSYLEQVSAEGGDEYLAEELLEEIETYFYPYTRRLCECNYLSESEANEFLEFCYSQVAELRQSLK